jgi:serine/threonine protein kinase
MASNKLDDLLLLDKLAAGGMAEVYRAIQQGYGGFEKIVAVKRILPHFASDEEFKNMFVMEANLSGLLQHPNVVQIFSNGESEGYLYLVMEFVDGKNLRQLLARADKHKVRIPIEFACYMIAEAAKGLEYAHTFVDDKTGLSMEIVHRDMSPQNIMLSYDGAVKIVDFGIAKAAARSEHTRAGVLKGKFGYMSPEQAQGMPIDRRTDIFALGIIFFELLTQRRLFSHDDDMRTLQLIRECNVPRPSKYNPSISPALDRIVLKSLAKNRGDRYSNAGEFYADVQRFINQKYPQFLPMDFAKFIKEKIFKEDIINEKKKREAIAAEAPARLGAPGLDRKKAEALKKKEDRDKDATQIDVEEENSQLTSVSEFIDLAAPKELAVEHKSPKQAKPVQEKIEISEVNADMSHEIPPPNEGFSEKTRITSSEIQEEEEVVVAAPAKAAPPKLEEEEENAAFGMSPAASHLSLSVNMGDKGPALPVNRSAPPRPAPLSSAAQSPVQRKVAQPMPRLEDTSHEAPSAPQNPYERIQYAKDKPVPSFVQSRSFILLMALAALGAYWHYQNETEKPTPQVAKTQDSKSEPKLQQETKPQTNVATQTQIETNRRPASQPLDAPVYVPSEATGYLNVRSFPSATTIYVDGHILIDNEGEPVRAPANLQRVDVGTRHVVLRNKALGISWEGQVEIEFDRVRLIEVRLK